MKKWKLRNFEEKMDDFKKTSEGQRIVIQHEAERMAEVVAHAVKKAPHKQLAELLLVELKKAAEEADSAGKSNVEITKLLYQIKEFDAHTNITWDWILNFIEFIYRSLFHRGLIARGGHYIPSFYKIQIYRFSPKVYKCDEPVRRGAFQTLCVLIEDALRPEFEKAFKDTPAENAIITFLRKDYVLEINLKLDW